MICILQSTVKEKSLALVGATTQRTLNTRANGSTYFWATYTLPDAVDPGAPSRYNSSGQLLFNPDWILGHKYNKDFIDAVVHAVEQVRVSWFPSSNHQVRELKHVSGGRNCRHPKRNHHIF